VQKISCKLQVVSCKREEQEPGLGVRGRRSEEQQKLVLRSPRRTRYSFQSEDLFFVLGKGLFFVSERGSVLRSWPRSKTKREMPDHGPA
jgi:hypothetical protein